MHIVDGALATPVLLGGGALAVAGLARGLKGLALEQIPLTGMMAALFFVASLVHVPVGPSSVHLIMSGLCGLMLGWAAFPALFVGLLLQLVFFGYGGLTVLGVNLVNIALPAVVIGLLIRPLLARASRRDAGWWGAGLWGAVAGGASIGLTTIGVALALRLSGQEFAAVAGMVLVAHLPVMLVEAVLTGAAIYLICRVSPELLEVAWQEEQDA